MLVGHGGTVPNILLIVQTGRQITLSTHPPGSCGGEPQLVGSGEDSGTSLGRKAFLNYSKDAVRGKVSINVSTNVLTAVKALNADFAQVQQGGNTDVKRAFWDGVSSMADCD